MDRSLRRPHKIPDTPEEILERRRSKGKRYYYSERGQKYYKAYRKTERYRTAVKVATRAYAKNNPDKILEKVRAQRARRAGAGGTFTNVEWMILKLEWNVCCAYCGIRSAELTQDHVVPLSRGGSNTKDNILPACSSCNSRKRDRDVLEFLMEMNS